MLRCAPADGPLGARTRSLPGPQASRKADLSRIAAAERPRKKRPEKEGTMYRAPRPGLTELGGSAGGGVEKPGR